jgi:putative CocE/NonD family hydrolase
MSAAKNSPQAEFGTSEIHRTPQYKGVTTQSLYIPMRDGVEIAIDVNLPKGLPAGEKVPSILIMARYWRSFQLRMTQPGKVPMGPRPAIADFLTSYGYAVITVDARGTGASFGTWQYPFSPEEIADYGEVVAWTINQPWSNGVVGAIGHSYEGTTAELLTVAHPTAVKAVIPQEIEFDLYADIVFPGGILNEWFIKVWDDTNRALDYNKVPKEWGFTARLFVKGVRPVDADKERRRLQRAIAEHSNNTDVYQAVRNITYRDDPFGSYSATLDDMSVFNHKQGIERSGAAIFGWGSWLDAAYADTVIHRFINCGNPQRAVIGAWSHNLQTHGSPYVKPKSAPIPGLKAQWRESLRFFDYHLKGIYDEEISDRVMLYFTMGEEKWHATTVWPPAGTVMERWYLAEDNLLAQEPPTTESGADTYSVDFEASTGTNNRWHTPDGVTPVIYKDRVEEDRRLLTYTSPPLAQDTEITGHPIVTLYVASTADDGAFYVYLEDVDERGKVTYVTEGQLRAIHRKVAAEPPPYTVLVPHHSFKRGDAMPLVPGEVAELSFGLLPTSVLIRKGHRIRIAIAGHDKDTFARIPAQGTPVLTVQRNSIHASYIDLPIIERL